jgi:hypothetical protein
MTLLYETMNVKVFLGDFDVALQLLDKSHICYLFLSLVQINCMFRDNVQIIYIHPVIVLLQQL